MIALRLDEVAAAVGGQLTPGTEPSLVATGLVIDSRQAGAGLLFAALTGDNADGHDFAAKALDAGAVATLAVRSVAGPAILVTDVAKAMADLASYSLRKLPQLRVIALTGSSGKTSTKDLVAALLEPAGPTIAPPGSYNNDLGVPLTVLRADESTRFLVLEMGARGKGHIARLCAIAPPSIGVVLNVGSAHLGEFGSRQATAEAKGELAQAARDVAILNADDPLVADMASRAQRRVVTFGEGRGAAVRAERIDQDEQGRATFRLKTPVGFAQVRLALVGSHHVANALAAAAVALECGRTPAQIAEALATATPRSRWRMEVREGPGHRTIINDSYNANPESMRAALKTLAVLGRPSAKEPQGTSERGARRTVAVLGPMYELGPTSVDEHDAIGRLAVRLDVGKLIVVGSDAAAIHTGAGLEGSWGDESVLVAGVSEALEVLNRELRDGDVVLIKASRAAGLERVAEALLAERAPDQASEQTAVGDA
jgi:UDP-N-acetylmuramoyl-tripeptide--D-alanyl-D-alanine ligase